METKIRTYKIEDTQAILDIINYILNSTMYDNIRSYEQQRGILEEK
jgi:phosphinothricin acetyltransferase